MPTYDYCCEKCGHTYEVMQGINDPHITLCPACNQDSLRRLIGGGAPPIFKGTGFYQTDYKAPKVEPKKKDG